MEKIYCGKCGKENPIENNFCYSCGEKLQFSKQNDSPVNFSKPLEKNYDEIRLALEQLIKNNGFIIISKGKYYVQFDNSISSRQLYFDCVSEVFFPEIGNKDEEFKKLSFTIENANYFKFIPHDKISIDDLIREIDFIFNEIYKIPLDDYKVKIDISDDKFIPPVTTQKGCFGSVLLLFFSLTVLSALLFF